MYVDVTVGPEPVGLGGASLEMQLLLLLRVCPPVKGEWGGEREGGERERGRKKGVNGCMFYCA